MGLAIASELPLVVIDSQRAGPSTGLPTKSEQSDLYQAVFGRAGDSPLAVIATRSPSDCFDVAVEAIRIATTFMTPVVVLSDLYIANAAEPWIIPDLDRLTPRAGGVSHRSDRLPSIPARRHDVGASVGDPPAPPGWSTASAAWKRTMTPARFPTTPTTIGA